MRRLLDIIALILTVCVITLSGCNTSGCLDNRSSLPLADFYSSTTDKPISTDSIDIYGVGARGDSLLVSVGQKASQVYLPLRSDMLSTSFCIAYKWEGMTPAHNDTLTIHYTSYPYFASEECGAMYRYIITGIDHTSVLLDSVAVLDSLVTNIEIANMRLYFPTDEETQRSSTAKNNGL
ncbi:MAG: hypothetical protein K2J42_07535 [Muribaculaceae bacterium]|nr:hypothetical protein [Muribaculaceae bacterium]